MRALHEQRLAGGIALIAHDGDTKAAYAEAVESGNRDAVLKRGRRAIATAQRSDPGFDLDLDASFLGRHR